VSTDYVFDGKENKLLTEEDKPNPINWYGQTKYLGEKEVENSGAPHTIVRIASPYRSGRHTKADYIQKIVNAIRTNSLYPMFTDQIVTLTHVDDIAEAFSRMIDNRALYDKELFHVVGSEPASPYDIAEEVAYQMGSEMIIKIGSLTQLKETDELYAQIFPQFLALSNSKVTNKLGIKFTSLSSGINQVIAV
jgi:dTDP-4-dehydrorhamnose reductase